MKVREHRKQSKKQYVEYSKDPREQKFFEDHGPFAYTGPSGTVLAFRDGASVLRSSAGYEHFESPSDKTKADKYRTIASYWEAIAEETSEEFLELKAQFKSKEIFYGDKEEAIEKLTALREKARRARAKHAAAKAKIEEEKPDWQRKREAIKAQHMRESEEFRKKVRSIKL